MGSNNYMLLVGTLAISLAVSAICLISFISEWRILYELKNFGKIKEGVVVADSATNKKKIIFWSSQKEVYHVEAHYLSKYTVDQKLPIIYSIRQPEISKIYLYMEYKFPLVLNGSLTIVFLLVFLFALLKRNWLLSQGGDFWPYG